MGYSFGGTRTDAKANIRYIFADTKEDIESLPSTVSTGSVVQVIDSGEQYILNTQGEWILQSEGSGSAPAIDLSGYVSFEALKNELEGSNPVLRDSDGHELSDQLIDKFDAIDDALATKVTKDELTHYARTDSMDQYLAEYASKEWLEGQEFEDIVDRAFVTESELASALVGKQDKATLLEDVDGADAVLRMSGENKVWLSHKSYLSDCNNMKDLVNDLIERADTSEDDINELTNNIGEFIVQASETIGKKADKSDLDKYKEEQDLTIQGVAEALGSKADADEVKRIISILFKNGNVQPANSKFATKEEIKDVLRQSDFEDYGGSISNFVEGIRDAIVAIEAEDKQDHDRMTEIDRRINNLVEAAKKDHEDFAASLEELKAEAETHVKETELLTKVNGDDPVLRNSDVDDFNRETSQAIEALATAVNGKADTTALDAYVKISELIAKVNGDDPVLRQSDKAGLSGASDAETGEPIDLSGYVKNIELLSKVDGDDPVIRESDMSGYISTSDFDTKAATLATAEALGAKADKSELNEYVKKSDPEFSNTKLLVCFGDSFGAQENGWPVKLSGILDNAGYLKNYCVSGAGWAYEANSIKSQVEKAAAEMGDDERASVAYVVIVAGRNDAASADTMFQKAQEVYDAARDAFPYARLIAAPYAWGSGMYEYDGEVFTWNDLLECDSVIGAWRQCGGEVLTYARLWIKGSPALVQDDGKHPNEKGSQIIAGYIAQAIRGAYTPRETYASREMSAGGEVWANFSLSGCQVNMNFNGNCPSYKKCYMPAWARPPQDVSGICYTNGGANQVLVFAKADGTVEIYGVTEGANLGGVGCTMTWTV